MPVPERRRTTARGGDFGDLPNDGDMCESGLVDVFRRPHPHLFEAVQVQQPVAARPGTAAGRIVLANHQACHDLGALRLAWRLFDDGRQIAAGETAAAVPVGTERELELPGLVAALARAGGERVLHLDYLLTRDLAWAASGERFGGDILVLGGEW